jgi:hypothetical protein
MTLPETVREPRQHIDPESSYPRSQESSGPGSATEAKAKKTQWVLKAADSLALAVLTEADSLALAALTEAGSFPASPGRVRSRF